MPHHANGSALRPRKPASVAKVGNISSESISNFRSWTAIKILKYGVEKKLCSKKGWLFKLLCKEGILEDCKQSKKARLWSDYQAQTLYIDAMKEVLEDDNLDPRRNTHLKSKKDGKFMTTRKEDFIPRNPLTALYLCHAYDVPYATFKRWKNESFVTKPIVPDNKGKSVIIDKKWASAIYNAKRMYIDTQMALWMSQLSTRQHDKEGKKVC
jgi:hypothetical protein